MRKLNEGSNEGVETLEVHNTAHSPDLLDLTSRIVVAYLHSHQVAQADVKDFVEVVYRALNRLSCAEDADARGGSAKSLVPAVSIRKSVTPDYIVCLEDGKKLKMLKRYLRAQYKMTPEEYKSRWGLPSNYPMVAPRYAERRSMLAKKNGLGRMTAGSRERARSSAKLRKTS